MWLAANLTVSPPSKPKVICPVPQTALTGVTPMQTAVTRDSSHRQLSYTNNNAVPLPLSIAELYHSNAQPVSSMHKPILVPSMPHNQVQHESAAARHSTTSEASVERLHCSASIAQHRSFTGRCTGTQDNMSTASSRHPDDARRIVTATATQQARAAASLGQQWQDSQGPQPSLLSFDSAVPSRSSNSMTAQLQPRAFSVSHPSSQPLLTPPHPLRHQSAAAATAAGSFRQQGCSANEALRPNSKDSQSGDSALSVDVSKISFRILTSDSGWAGQRGPCSPLTPIPDSPSSPLLWCR